MKRTFTFRVEDALWDKFHKISGINKRSVNNQLECIVEDFVKAFERENGEIPLDCEE